MLSVVTRPLTTYSSHQSSVDLSPLYRTGITLGDITGRLFFRGFEFEKSGNRLAFVKRLYQPQEDCFRPDYQLRVTCRLSPEGWKPADKWIAIISGSTAPDVRRSDSKIHLEVIESELKKIFAADRESLSSHFVY